MRNALKVSGAFIIIATALAACSMSHGPGGVAYSTGDAGSVGATQDAAGGAVSGGSTGNTKTEQRGNTPIGNDRDGHGPAHGAILDPTGAATRGTPY